MLILEDASGSMWTFPIVTTFKNCDEEKATLQCMLFMWKEDVNFPHCHPHNRVLSWNCISFHFFKSESQLDRTEIFCQKFWELDKTANPPQNLWIMRCLLLPLLSTQAGLQISLGCSSIPKPISTLFFSYPDGGEGGSAAWVLSTGLWCDSQWIKPEEMMPGWCPCRSWRARPRPTKGPFSAKMAYFSFQADVHYAANPKILILQPCTGSRRFCTASWSLFRSPPLYFRLKWEPRYGQR